MEGVLVGFSRCRSACRLALSVMSAAVAVVWLASQHPARAGGDAAVVRTEPSLEPEFRQLRATLGALPEFSGPDAESKVRLANELAHRGDMTGAIETYRAAIQAQPRWADPYRGLGAVLLDHHEYGEAVEALQTGIRLGRDDHQAFYWLGRALMGKGELPAAASALAHALDLQPDDADTVADLGLVRMALGDAAGAEEAFIRSIRLKPDYTEAHRLRDRLMKVKHDRGLTREAGRQILTELFERE